MVHSKMNLNQSLEDPKFLSLGKEKRNASDMLFHPKIVKQRLCRAEMSKHSAVLRAWLSSRQALLTAET